MYAIHYATGEREPGFETTAEALVWECEADSEDDDGARAFAEIRRERGHG